MLLAESAQAESEASGVVEARDLSTRAWQRFVAATLPLFSNTFRVHTEQDPNTDKKPVNGGRASQLWQYSTDCKGGINALVHEPATIERIVRKEVVPRFAHLVPDLDSEQLYQQIVSGLFFYLMLHEQTHNTDCPNSDADRKKIAGALKDGIAEQLFGTATIPKGRVREVVMKALNANNMASDQIVDFLAYVRSRAKIGGNAPEEIRTAFSTGGHAGLESLVDGTELVWDIVEIANSKGKGSNPAYALSRMIYVTMFVEDEALRADLLKYFAKASGLEDANERLAGALAGFVSGLDSNVLEEVGVNKQQTLLALQNAARAAGDAGQIGKIYDALSRIFVNQTRYGSLKGYIKPFADILPSDDVKGKNCGGAGGVASDTSSLLDSLSDEELQELAQGEAETPAGGADGGKGSAINTVLYLAADEFYKRLASEVALRNPEIKTIEKDIGFAKVWQPKSSATMTVAEFEEDVDLEGVMAHMEQVGDGLPVLIYNGDGTVTLNEYEQREVQLRSWDVAKGGIEVPDYFAVMFDASGSMFSGVKTGENWVGSACPYNTMCKITYGLWKSLLRAGKSVSREAKAGLGQFSNNTTWSGFKPLDEVYDGASNPVKEEILRPQAGGTDRLDAGTLYQIASEIEAGKKGLIAIVSDGFDPIHNGDEVLSALENIAQKPNQSVVWIEIGNRSGVGQAVEQLAQRYKNITYKRVDSMAGVQSPLQQLAIQYKRASPVELARLSAWCEA